jgi:hypothetical protein
MTIHQPRTDILEMCDKIHLLAAGRTVFFGPLEDALTFFAKLEYPLPPKTNPSDHFLDVVTLDQRSPELQQTSLARIELFANAWEKEKSDKKLLVDIPKAVTNGDAEDGKLGILKSHSGKYNSSWLTQLWILLGRNMKDVLRDKATIGATLGQGVIIALVMGFIFFVSICNLLSSLTSQHHYIQYLILLLFYYSKSTLNKQASKTVSEPSFLSSQTKPSEQSCQAS